MTENILQERIKQLRNECLSLSICDDEDYAEKREKEINQEIAYLTKQIEKQRFIEEKPKTKKEDIKYETFNDPNLNCNQWVIEIHKAGTEINGKFVEDFSVYTNLYYALNRLGEQRPCFHALLYYLNNNKHKFNFVLWRANFEKELGYKEHAYYDAINALFYYGILEKTNRVKRNEKGVCCKVYIFHSDLKIEELPKERFEPKNNEHMKIVRERKG